MHAAIPQPGGAVVVMTTVGTADQAASLARDLVSRRLAACVTRLPAAPSIYSWRGQIHEDEEILLLIKTTTGRLAGVQQFLDDRHPYELPEFLVLPVAHASDRYLDWLCEATGAADTEEG